MEIRIRYRNNRVDGFDTDTFTKSEPFGNANMLTDFEHIKKLCWKRSTKPTYPR